mmetsp:Transcript_34062/g.46620  ORF Transcript_34062/g.46620 Transcript_34062/m.46620 type:complete len:87 (-) Transcript_34062:6-266(-)
MCLVTLARRLYLFGIRLLRRCIAQWSHSDTFFKIFVIGCCYLINCLRYFELVLVLRNPFFGTIVIFFIIMFYYYVSGDLCGQLFNL